MNQTKTIFYFPSLALAHLYSIIPLRMLFITLLLYHCSVTCIMLLVCNPA